MCRLHACARTCVQINSLRLLLRLNRSSKDSCLKSQLISIIFVWLSCLCHLASRPSPMRFSIFVFRHSLSHLCLCLHNLPARDILLQREMVFLLFSFIPHFCRVLSFLKEESFFCPPNLQKLSPPQPPPPPPDPSDSKPALLTPASFLIN